MAREILYQSVGNPLQRDRLPTRRSELALPFHPYRPSQDARFAVRIAGYVFAFSAVATITRWSVAAWFESGLTTPWFCANLAAFTAAVVLVVHGIKKATFRDVRLPLMLLVAGTFCLNIPLPFAVHLVAAGSALGWFTRLLANHWIRYCTTSPLSKSTAVQLQLQWNAYVTGMACVPVALAMSYILLPRIFTHGAIVAFALFQLAQAAGQRHSKRWSVAWRTLVSWLTYDRNDVRPPGVFCSPAGPWPLRLAATAACVVALSAVVGSMPADLEFVSQLAGAPSDIASTTDTRLHGYPPYVLKTWLVVCLLSMPLPAIITLICPLILNLPVLTAADSVRAEEVTAKNWRELIEDLRHSPDPLERKSLYMGRIAHDGSPLLVPRETFYEHAHFLGDSGAGKTSLGLAPFIEQVGASGDYSIIVIDLKADSMELLATLSRAANEAQRRTGVRIPVKHFTNQNDRSTFAFNLLRYPFWKKLELYLRTDILCGALGLSYGADYGEGYYSSANAANLHHTLKSFPDVSSFRELSERLAYVAAHAKRSELNPEIKKAGVHVHTVVDRLGSFEALNVTPEAGYPQEVVDEAIDLAAVFEEPQFLYFHLSSTLGPGSSPEIARLATYSLLAAATQARRRHQVYLVIDEFQRMVASNIEYMLQLARSMGVGVILANQTMQDLKTSKANLIPSIEANCRYRQWFSVSSVDERERLVQSSGDTVDLLTTRTYRPAPNGNVQQSLSQAEHVVKRLTANDVLLASDHPLQSVVRISRGDGYAQYGGMPFVVSTNYHISKSEYEARKTSSWPDGMAGSFQPGTTAQQPTPSPPVQGPSITTGVIGGPAADAGSTANPFASFIQTAPPPKPKRRRRRRN